MDNSLKQRIVGAVVLIALAVIFLPLILKEKTRQASFQSKIPARPIELVREDLKEEVVNRNQQLQTELDKLGSAPRKQKQTQPSVQEEKPEVSVNSSSSESSIAKPSITKPPQVQTKPTEALQVSKQKISDKFSDAAWVIQIASFSNRDNAVSFVEKLKKAGHKAYRRESAKQGKTIYRIFVGPYIEKERATKALAELKKLTDSRGILLPFDPVDQ